MTGLKDCCQALDKYLSNLEDVTAEQQALELVAQSTSETGPLRAFGSTPQAVPKRIYTIEELRLNNIRAEALLSPVDTSLNFTRNVAQAAAGAGLLTLAVTSGFDAGRVLGVLVGMTFALVADQVANQGGGEALVVDNLGRLLKPSYGKRVAYHEAGHFLVAYLVGVLPRAYTLSSLDAFRRFQRLNIQAGTQFCDSVFVKEVQSGRISASSLEKYTCVALAGVVTEYLRFGQAEGGVGDVMQLDSMFRGLNFTQLKADGEVRWAVLNVAAMLRRHEALHDRLAEGMQRGASVGELIQMIETCLQEGAA